MKLYRQIHYLSLDIVLGALATSCLATRLFQASPGWVWWVTLALTVWLLYTGDHLLDAWKHRKLGLREMHAFILRNRKVLIWSMGVACVADVMLIINSLERPVLKVALALGGAVLLFYAVRHLLTRNRFLFIPGELFVLVLYLAGTWMGPFVTRSAELLPSHGMIAVMMGLVLLMNLGIISLYDMHLDSRLGVSSLARTLGQHPTRNMILGAAATAILLTVFQFLVYGIDRYFQFALVLTGMALVLLPVLLMPSRFRNLDAYRLTADGVLFMGFLSLLIK